MSINELFQIGVCRKKYYGAIINPSRYILLRFLKPYFSYLLDYFDKLIFPLKKDSDAMAFRLNSIESHLEHINNGLESILNLVNFDQFKLSLNKDLDAMTFRFNSIESHLEQLNKGLESILTLVNTEYGICISKPSEIISDELFIDFAREALQVRKGNAIEVGSSLGSTTLAFGTMFEHVFTFEPNNYKFRILKANVILNNLSNVKLYNNHLDKLDSYEFNEVAFIKISAQGADVLFGALETIRRCRPVIVFECEFSIDTLIDCLPKLNYKVSPIKGHHGRQIYVCFPQKDYV